LLPLAADRLDGVERFPKIQGSDWHGRQPGTHIDNAPLQSQTTGKP
jgi:hypothetical protein